MRLIIQEDQESVADWVSQYVCKRINEFNPSAKRPFVLGMYFVVLTRPWGIKYWTQDCPQEVLRLERIKSWLNTTKKEN